MSSEKLEKLKLNGAVLALKEHLDSQQNYLLRDNFKSTRSDNKFRNMALALDNAETLIKAMRETLKALQELEPGNT